MLKIRKILEKQKTRAILNCDLVQESLRVGRSGIILAGVDYFFRFQKVAALILLGQCYSFLWVLGHTTYGLFQNIGGLLLLGKPGSLPQIHHSDKYVCCLSAAVVIVGAWMTHSPTPHPVQFQSVRKREKLLVENVSKVCSFAIHLQLYLILITIQHSFAIQGHRSAVSTDWLLPIAVESTFEQLQN